MQSPTVRHRAAGLLGFLLVVLGAGVILDAKRNWMGTTLIAAGAVAIIVSRGGEATES